MVSNNDIDFSCQEFSSQMNELSNLNFKFISYQDILCNNIIGNKNILITIDDGSSSIKRITNILKLYNIKPILFVYTYIIGQQRYALTYEDLSNFILNDYTIGSHGFYHGNLNKNFCKNIEAVKRELNTSKIELEYSLNIPINIYAYPCGVYSEEGINYVMKYKYWMAFSIDEGVNILPIFSNTNVYCLSRYLVTRQGWNRILNKLRSVE